MKMLPQLGHPSLARMEEMGQKDNLEICWEKKQKFWLDNGKNLIGAS